MVQETAVAKRGETGLQQSAVGQQALVVTPEYVENTVRSLSLLRSLVHEVLQEGRDYGSVPGLPEFLWNPGASTIISSFNCHIGQRRILSLINDGQKLSVVIEVPVIHNISQLEVGSGIGATTIAETRYKYRWEQNPQDWGYSEEQIDKFETRERYDHTEYKIPNPEPGELLNTVIKQASKRAEVDAAEALPGAASALKELLDPRLKKGYKPSNANAPTGDIDGNSPRWTAFWSQAKALLDTLAEEQGIEVSALAHRMLGIKSMKDWIKAGKSLDDAVRVLSEQLAKQGETNAPKVKKSLTNRTEASINTTMDLLQACNYDFGMQPAAVWKELGYTGQKNFEEAKLMTPWEAYCTIREVKKQPDVAPS